MAAPQPPDLQVFGDAVNGMTTTMQAYIQHQQTMSQQLQLIGSQPPGAVIQNLANSVQALTTQMQAQAAHQEAQMQAQTTQMQAQAAHQEAQMQAQTTQMQAQAAHQEAQMQALTTQMQAQAAHQAAQMQALTTQMQAQAAHQAAQMQALTTQMQAGFAQVNARIDNIDVKSQNSKRYVPADNLEVPCSLDTSVNAQVPVGTPIANFPPTTLALMAINILECRRILKALTIPFHNNNNVATLRLKIRKAIGLPGL